MFFRRPLGRAFATSFITVFTILSITALPAMAADKVLHVQPGNRAQLFVDPGRTMRPWLPGSIYSANMQYNQFDLKHWDKHNHRIKPQVLDGLAPMHGAFYRYPGGLPADTFRWEPSVLDYSIRRNKRSQGGSVNLNTLFGVGEYIEFINDISVGTPWYTLNLIGEGTTNKPVEWPTWQVANSNEALAKYIVARTPGVSTRYYQLGNELDRNHFQWSHDKYVERSRASINKILQHDPNAKFVPFMREFNWTYKWPKSGVSTAENYFRDVMRGLPMVTDFSLHFYFDGKLAPSKPFITVPDLVGKIEKALRLAKKARNANYNVWITEYGKRFYLSGGTPESGTSFDAALATGDFLITLAQIPEVKGAFLQGLDGGDRMMFFDSNKPTSSYWAVRILAGQPHKRVLASQSISPNKSGYQGGYDVRAVALTNDAGNQLGINAVNRSSNGTSLRVVYPPMKGRNVQEKRRFVKAANGANPKYVEKNFFVRDNPIVNNKKFNSDGSIYIWLPPLSVVSVTLE